MQQEKITYIDWEGKIKLSLFTDDIIICVENPEEVTKSLLELVSNYTKVIGSMLIYQSQPFFHMPAMKA